MDIQKIRSLCQQIADDLRTELPHSSSQEEHGGIVLTFDSQDPDGEKTFELKVELRYIGGEDELTVNYTG